MAAKPAALPAIQRSDNNMKCNAAKYILAVMLFIGVSCKKESPLKKADARQVYICVSSTAYSYHFRQDCTGLKKCKHSIKLTTVEIAKKQGRTFCGWEANDSLLAR